MLKKPWEALVGVPRPAVAIVSIANYFPIADIGIHALGLSIEGVDTLIDKFFGPNILRCRIEWTATCVCISRYDLSAIHANLAHIRNYLDANSLEILGDEWVDHARVDIKVATGLAFSPEPVSDAWPLVLAAVDQTNREQQCYPVGWRRSFIQPHQDMQDPKPSQVRFIL